MKRYCRFPGFTFLLCLLVLLAAPSYAAEKVQYDSLQVYFSPQGGCQQAIIEALDGTQKTLDIAMFAFTSREIAEAVVRAHSRGVTVRVVMDESQSANKYSKKIYFQKKGIPLRLSRGIGRGIMHDKFAVIDGNLVITGSFNWTASAEENNYENLLVIRSPLLVMKYSEEFEKIWRSAPASSEEKP